MSTDQSMSARLEFIRVDQETRAALRELRRGNCCSPRENRPMAGCHATCTGESSSPRRTAGGALGTAIRISSGRAEAPQRPDNVGGSAVLSSSPSPW